MLQLCSHCRELLRKNFEIPRQRTRKRGNNRKPGESEPQQRQTEVEVPRNSSTQSTTTSNAMYESRGIDFTILPKQGQDTLPARRLAQDDLEETLGTVEPEDDTNRERNLARAVAGKKLPYLEYLKLGLDRMKRLCDERGISLERMPKHGSTGWLAGRLRDHDEKGANAQMSS